MAYTFIPLTELPAPALLQLADLHHQVMHTLLSELGLPLVRKYYQAAQKHTGNISLCAIDKNGKLCAWATGSANPSALNHSLRQPAAWFLWQIFSASLRKPSALLHLLGSLLADPTPNQLRPSQLELTYIGVSPQAQGKGLGTDLLGRFIHLAGQAGYSSIALSVETDNPAAIRLYTQSGFTITRTFHEGRFERHRMEYQIHA